MSIGPEGICSVNATGISHCLPGLLLKRWVNGGTVRGPERLCPVARLVLDQGARASQQCATVPTRISATYLWCLNEATDKNQITSFCRRDKDGDQKGFHFAAGFLHLRLHGLWPELHMQCLHDARHSTDDGSCPSADSWGPRHGHDRQGVNWALQQ